jgi:3-oxoacyl-[acyl-carrier-protein] synthase-3
MALHAATEACKRCGQRPDDIDVLLYADSWHQGPAGWHPQYYLQRHLVGGDALSVEIRHGCNGMFSALELASCQLLAGRRRAALLVAADNYGTPLVDRWQMGPGFVVGDAASAVVLTREPGFARLLSVGSLTVPEAEEVHRSGEPMFPPGPTLSRPLDFAERAADFNRRTRAEGSGTAAWLKVHQTMVALVDRTLREAGITVADVTRASFMNYSREIVEQRGMLALGLSMAKSTWDFGRNLGHLGASDQIVSLDHLVVTGQVGPGDHVLMIGIGPGVTISAAVVGIVADAPWTG